MKKFFSVILSAALLTVGLSGCGEEAEKGLSGLSSLPSSTEEAVIPEEYMIETGNNFDYQGGMECAAFSSAYLLRHYGEEADGMTLFETFPSRAADGGTMPYGIETLFNEREGYTAEYVCDGTIEDIKKELVKGAPVIVFIHVSEPYTSTHNTHYVPIVGYDKEYFYFAESLSDYANCKDEENLPYNRKTEFSKFKRLWENIDGMWDNPYYVISKEEKTDVKDDEESKAVSKDKQ